MVIANLIIEFVKIVVVTTTFITGGLLVVAYLGSMWEWLLRKIIGQTIMFALFLEFASGKLAKRFTNKKFINWLKGRK